MAVTLSLFAGAGAQFFNDNGKPLSGGKVYTYWAGTTTPLTTYTTTSGTISHANPIVLDAAGRVPGGEIWLQLGVGYKFVVRSSTDALVATYDNIPSSAQPPAANDADSIMYEQGYTVTAGSFVVGKFYRIVSVGTTDFTLIGSANNIAGTHFTATGAGTGTGTAELSQTVESKLAQTVSVKDFGAVGDGVSDDTAALQNAFALSGKRVSLPGGNYLYTGDLSPVCAEIIGDGEQASVLIPSSSVANPFILGSDGPRFLHGFSIDGVNTSGKIGAYVGKDTSWAGVIESVRIIRFQGSNAANMKIKKGLKSRMKSLTLSQGQNNLIIDGTGTSGYPTTITFDTLGCIDAVNEGCIAIECETVVFNQPFFDSNGKEALKIVSNASGTAVVIMNQPRFEGNWGSTTTEYQVKVDGSAASSRAQIVMNDPQFSGSGSSAKNFIATGSNANFTIKNPTLRSALTGGISCVSNAYGEILEWQANSGMTFDTVVNDPLNRVSSPSGSANSRSWVPTFSDGAGTGFSSTTITHARYQLLGKRVLFSVDVGYTLAGAGAPQWVRISVPTNLTPAYSSTVLGWLNINGTWQAGMGTAVSDGYIYIRKIDNSGFPVGSTNQFRVSMEYFIP